jgi:polyphenol oxidase
MSFSHAKSPEEYHANLQFWSSDWQLEPKYRTGRTFFLHLVHGTNILRVDHETPLANPPGHFIPRCDGLITGLCGESSVVLTVKTADCVPVFVFDSHTRSSGLLHCGWKGLSENFVRAALRKMRDELNTRMSSTYVHIGPHIFPDRYEVGPEVSTLFPSHLRHRDQGTFLDLASIVRHQAEGEGVHPANISQSRHCTYDRDDLFFSARRDGLGGAMLSFITVPS